MEWKSICDSRCVVVIVLSQGEYAPAWLGTSKTMCACSISCKAFQRLAAVPSISIPLHNIFKYNNIHNKGFYWDKTEPIVTDDQFLLGCIQLLIFKPGLPIALLSATLNL